MSCGVSAGENSRRAQFPEIGSMEVPAGESPVRKRIFSGAAIARRYDRVLAMSLGPSSETRASVP
jgi:hypothetical protein